MPDFFDIHTHVNFAAYSDDREEVIKRSLDHNTWMVLVGTQVDTSIKAVKIAEEYEEGVYVSIGLHPVHTCESHVDEQELGGQGEAFKSRGELFEEKDYEEIIKSEKVVSIGECGLDYYRSDEKNKKIQIKNFERQIEFAVKHNKPLMIHCRDAYDDLIDILKDRKKEYGDKIVGNVHFFAGDVDVAKRFLDLDFTMSFTGVITFTKDYDEVVRYVPIDKIMSETDAPYVTPTPFRGQRNEPIYVEYVVKRIAQIRNSDFLTLKDQLIGNSLNFFRMY